MAIVDLDIRDRFYLTEDVRNYIQEQKEHFGFGLLGAAVYFRTYSRTQFDGSQEVWADTVIRVVEGLFTIRKWWYLRNGIRWDDQYWQSKAADMADAIFNFHFLPPGRSLWAMGVEHTYNIGSMALNNCFAGTETFLTRAFGSVPLSDVVDEPVEVLTKDGWRSAVVKSFGVQQLQEVVFTPVLHKKQSLQGLRSNHTLRKQVTANHRWELVDGSLTTDLQIGDVIPTVRYQPDTTTVEYKKGFTHGLVFGDGTRQSSLTYRVRLCGDKVKHEHNFDRVTYPKHMNGDALAFVRSPMNLKDFPVMQSPDYIGGFINGWVAMDGTHASEASITLDTQVENGYQWLTDNAPYGGYVVTGVNSDDRPTNYGERSNTLYRVRLRASDDVSWKVASIVKLDEAPVYCVVNPSNERFTLSGGLYTSNCGYREITHLSADVEWLADALMLGVGTGFSTQTYNVELRKPLEIERTFVVPDTREGWVQALGEVIRSYENGTETVRFDYSQVRPEGAPIKGFGGIASGPEPLEKGIERIRGYLESHLRGETSSVRLVTDTINAVGAVVVSGNVRRSAEIALGRADNTEFINLKNFDMYPEREEIGWMSNNSVILETYEDFHYLPELADRIRYNGEPGIFNLINIQKYGRYGERMLDKATGANPCGEIPLESSELCCLSEVFPTRCVDEYGNFSVSAYYKAVELATLYASTVSLLPTHSRDTNEIIERNHRIGVSLSGIADWLALHHATDVITWLDKGYKLVRSVNTQLALEAGVRESIRVTTVKPSGSISLLAGVSSGVHLPPFSRYLRRVRVSENSPIVPVLTEAHVPNEPDTYSDRTLVFEFPVDQGKVRGQKDVSVWAKAATVQMLQKFWADNMVSNTLTFDPVREGSQIEDLLTYTVPYTKTISLLPLLDEGSVYAQAPIEQITLEEVRRREKEIKDIDWSNFGGSDGVDSKFCDSDGCVV